MGSILKVKDKNSGKWIDISAIKGDDGKSAYELAVESGYEGTEEDLIATFNAILSGVEVTHLINKNNPHEVTAAQVGALSDTGGTITGHLTMNNKDSYYALIKHRRVGDVDYTLTLGVNESGATRIDSYKNNSFVRGLEIGEDVLRIKQKGSVVEGNILHTGNKPSGTYTGNGDSTTRTINVGGVGNLLLIYVSSPEQASTQDVAMVTSWGSYSLVNGFCDNVTHYRNGILSICGVGHNTKGISYTYQVL